MLIRKITAYVVKQGTLYDMGGDSKASAQLPHSEYMRFRPYPQLYSRRSEALILKIETDDGIVGWGESQAPIGPEVTQSVVHHVLGPAVLGLSALDTNVRYTEMYETQRVRGHMTGFLVDALAGIDIALWDIRGKVAGLPVSALLGGRYREMLACYVSGLRRKSHEARLDEASEFIEQGITGVKIYVGHGLREDAQEIERLRERLGPDVRIYVDAVWRYDFADAVKLGRICERNDVDFLEAPMLPEDIEGHARLARELDVAVAVGEPLRTRFQFQPWFVSDAFDVCQPDIMRNGISEAYKIAMVAEAFNKPIAFHTGCVTAIGLAATFHTAAAIPNFLTQEYQPVMFETFNRWLKEPLSIRGGNLMVPTGPGLGVDLDEERFLADVTGMVEIAL
jgi:L-alanine-DL-glutamate epimerase-like enolase superfamily enzyme